MDNIRLWTIQPVEVYEELTKTGRFICNPALSDNIAEPMFDDAYKWLDKQMEKRVGSKPKGVTYPIWAWHTFNWKHKKPDLRMSGYANRGEKLVAIEIEIPDREVLLTDFDSWGFVLNKWFLSSGNTEEECDKDEEEYKALPKNKQKKALEKSWENIFDLGPFCNDWTWRGRYIQATFWELKMEYVKKVQFFTAK